MRRGSSHGHRCRVRVRLPFHMPPQTVPPTNNSTAGETATKASWLFGSQRPPIVSCSPSTSQPASANPPLQGATSPSLLTGCTMACWAMFMGYLSSWLQEGAVSGLSLLQNLGVARLGNLINLGKNAGTLAQEMKQLREIEDDLVRQVELEEIRPRMKRTSQVNGWIQRVDELEDEVGTFQTSFEGRRTCLEGCSFDSVYANYELGQKAADLLGQVTGLKNQRVAGLGGELVQLGPPEAVVAVPSTRIVGGEKIRSEIRSHLQDDEVRVIGIYGMGGVGKTTYLTEINNGAPSNDFQVVIWVTVTKDVDIRRIQEDISVRLGFSRQQLPTNEADRRNALSQALSRKKFLLLLDDVWEKLELIEVGIPLPPENQTKAKVVFTTRFKETCNYMGAQKMVKVDFLNERDSWNLFCLKVGEEVDLNNSSLKPSAEKVVARCGGLPLALVTVGLAMAGAKTITEWEDALASLREAPQDVQNMEKEVLSVLKFSFDKLKHDSLRHCLLYCALYPEDHEISTEELIEFWIGEGFLDPKHSTTLDRARRKGREVVRSLKDACLLESAGSHRGVDYVKMHDVVRDMALWLTSGEHDDETDVFVVNQSGEGSYRLPSSDRWERAKRISLMTRASENVEWPDLATTCPHLQTLLIRGTATTSGSIFKFMPALRILDLSFSIREPPAEIGLLVEGTALKSLPKELGNLVRLRHLNLKSTFFLQSIPAEAILRLRELRLLNLFQSRYNVTWEYPSETNVDDDETNVDDDETDDDDEINVDYAEEITLEGIERHLCRLEELGVSLDTTKSLEGLMNSNRLSKCTRYLLLSQVSDLRTSDLSMALERLQGLRELSLYHCRGLEELRFGGGSQLQSLEVLSLFGFKTRILTAPPHRILQRLRRLFINGDDSLKELTWTRYLPSLENITLICCQMLEELVRADGQGSEACGSSTEDNSFPNLKQMTLLNLPSLKTISEHPLLLPSLEELVVDDCPGLKKLPLGAHSGKKLRAIRGTQRWWDQLEWDEDSGVKGIFISRFNPIMILPAGFPVLPRPETHLLNGESGCPQSNLNSNSG